MESTSNDSEKQDQVLASSNLPAGRRSSSGSESEDTLSTLNSDPESQQKRSTEISRQSSPLISISIPRPIPTSQYQCRTSSNPNPNPTAEEIKQSRQNLVRILDTFAALAKMRAQFQQKSVENVDSTSTKGEGLDRGMKRKEDKSEESPGIVNEENVKKAAKLLYRAIFFPEESELNLDKRAKIESKEEESLNFESFKEILSKNQNFGGILRQLAKL